MDKEKKEKIALFRLGVISRLLWEKKEERQQDVLLREMTSTPWESPFSGRPLLSLPSTRSRHRFPRHLPHPLHPLPTRGKGQNREMVQNPQDAVSPSPASHPLFIPPQRTL